MLLQELPMGWEACVMATYTLMTIAGNGAGYFDAHSDEEAWDHAERVLGHEVLDIIDGMNDDPDQPVVVIV